MRFDGRLYFANVSYFEDAVLNAVADNPEAPYVLIVGDGINDIDASGEEVIHHLVERLNENGIVVLFAGLKKQVHRRDARHRPVGHDRREAASSPPPSRRWSTSTRAPNTPARTMHSRPCHQNAIA